MSQFGTFSYFHHFYWFIFYRIGVLHPTSVPETDRTTVYTDCIFVNLVSSKAFYLLTERSILICVWTTGNRSINHTMTQMICLLGSDKTVSVPGREFYLEMLSKLWTHLKKMELVSPPPAPPPSEQIQFSLIFHTAPIHVISPRLTI